MAELPIMPLKTDALIADTTHMSAEEMGAYCRLLFAMWRHGGTLPDDPKELANIAGVSRRKWFHIAERVTRPMTKSGGILSQKRLSSTWQNVQKLREQKAAAALKRWGKRNANGSFMHDA